MDLLDRNVLPVLRSARWVSDRPVLGEFAFPVQLLDVHEMVAAHGDGPSTYTPLYRTIAIFLVGRRVPDFEMDPIGFAGRSMSGILTTYPGLASKERKLLAFATRLMARTLDPLLGAARATFSCAAGTPEEEVLRNFGKNYLLQLGESCWVGEGAEVSLAPGTEEAFRGVFHRAVLGYFAATPGWIVQSAGGWLALWHEDRILADDELPQFLRETWQVHDVVTSKGPGCAS